MIIQSDAPCRISLFGGSSDLPSFYKKHGGMVISFAINLRQHFTFYTHKDIWGRGKDEFPYNAQPEFIYNIFNERGIGGGHHIKIKSRSDAYLRGGLGSSAAAAVATLAAINRIIGIKQTDPISLIIEGYEAEEKMGWYGGVQDYWASVLGGANVLNFKKDGNTFFQPILKDTAEKFSQGMVLFWTGERKEKNMQDSFRKLSKDQEQAILDIKEMALQSLPLILHHEFEKVGKLLGAYWKMKKKSNPAISNKIIDAIYAQAIQAGALGGKLLGAGGGGYMLFIVDPANRQSFINEMAKNNHEEIDFSIDWQGAQARIL